MPCKSEQNRKQIVKYEKKYKQKMNLKSTKFNKGFGNKHVCAGFAENKRRQKGTFSIC